MTKMSFENHIMKQFDEELEEIRTRLMEMGGKVEHAVKRGGQRLSRTGDRRGRKTCRRNGSGYR